MPDIAAWMKSWNTHHSGWTHVLWTDDDLRSFLSMQHPDALSLWDNYPHGVMRSDMVRPYLLWSFGGLYADVDYEALSSLEPALQGYGLFIVGSPFKTHEDVQNSLMASRPRHPFWKKVMALLFERQPGVLDIDPNVMEQTGPGLLSKAVREYASNKSLAAADHVRILNADTFMPTFLDGYNQRALHHHVHSWFANGTREDIHRAGFWGLLVTVEILIVLLLDRFWHARAFLSKDK